MAHFTAPTCRFEVGESSAHAARQPRSDVTHKTNYSFVDIVDVTPGRPMSREVGYGIMDVWLDMVGDMEGRAPTTLEELSQRVTDLAATLARDTHGMNTTGLESQSPLEIQSLRMDKLMLVAAVEEEAAPEGQQQQAV
nr:hypothetical protein [Tanacetum cinerariifolium]